MLKLKPNVAWVFPFTFHGTFELAEKEVAFIWLKEIVTQDSPDNNSLGVIPNMSVIFSNANECCDEHKSLQGSFQQIRTCNSGNEV